MGVNAILDGWSFQIVTGVYFFIENIKEITEFKFEGEEDIVIRKNDGTKVFIEAKCSTKPKDQIARHITYHLNGSLKKYNKRKKDNDDYTYFYSTNIYYPFNDGDKFENHQISRFDNLSSDQKDMVLKFVDSDITDKLVIARLLYDDDNKLLVIEEQIQKLLSLMGSRALKFKSEEILNKWIVNVLLNGTRKHSYIDKKEMIWKIILLELKESISDYFDSINILLHEQEIIEEYYYSFIEPFENKLTIINSIYKEYIKDCEMNNFDNERFYIKYSNVCFDEVERILPKIKTREKELLSQLLVVNIIKKYKIIESVKDVTNYENK